MVGIIVTDCGTVDLPHFIFGQADVTRELRKLVSLWSGVVINLGALWFDIRTRSEKDFAFWLSLHPDFHRTWSHLDGHHMATQRECHCPEIARISATAAAGSGGSPRIAGQRDSRFIKRKRAAGKSLRLFYVDPCGLASSNQIQSSTIRSGSMLIFFCL